MEYQLNYLASLSYLDLQHDELKEEYGDLPAKVEELVVLNVTVPELLLNVPLLVKLLDIVKDPAEPGAVRVPLAFIVRLPLTPSDGLFVAPVTVTALVPFPIVKLLDTLIVWDAAEPRVNVGAEATVGAKLKL